MGHGKGFTKLCQHTWKQRGGSDGRAIAANEFLRKRWSLLSDMTPANRKTSCLDYEEFHFHKKKINKKIKSQDDKYAGARLRIESRSFVITPQSKCLMFFEWSSEVRFQFTLKVGEIMSRQNNRAQPL